MASRIEQADLEWAHDQIEQYRLSFPRYREFGALLEVILRKAANKHAPGAIVQVRPKSIASFAEKIQRKRAKYRDPVNELTDLCGGRVITNTPDEVLAVCGFIEQYFDIDWENTIDVSQRLKASEFGYRSVHYIVKFKPGMFPTEDVDVEIPEKILGLKAEIQVRTILEHAWADYNHRLFYKSPFRVPAQWQREVAGLAAMLETVDKAFARIADGLATYASNYGTYMTQDQMRSEIELLHVVLAHDPGNLELAHRAGKMALALGDWATAIDLFSPPVESGHQPILRDLGVALCKQHADEPHGEAYRQGQLYLEMASAPRHCDADALASFAGTWLGIDDDRARELYRQAFEIDPSDSYPLGRYLELEIVHNHEVSFLACLRPTILAAIEHCREQARAGVNLPWAFYDIAKLSLLIGRPYDSLEAYIEAMCHSPDDWMIETSLKSLDNLAVVKDSLPGYDWGQRLMVAELATRFPTRPSQARVQDLALIPGVPIHGPVLVVAGGCDAQSQAQMEKYAGLMLDAFDGFTGTLISGGTTAGIAGIVGAAQERYPETIHSIGYLPSTLPPGAALDPRYREIRHTDGSDFSPLEPVQYWIDLIASNIDPADVKVIGIGGGAIAAMEYRLALALGATVAIIQGSGREAGKLLADDEWSRTEGLIALPADGAILRAFVGSAKGDLAPDIREPVAQAIHEAYRRAEAERRHIEDVALAAWNCLLEDFRESNRQQADHIMEKLRRIGYTVQRFVEGQVCCTEFTADEVDEMAQMEHARWVVERLDSGWVWGSERNAVRRENPALVEWSMLPADAKEQNREAVRQIPSLLAGVGLVVCPLEDDDSTDGARLNSETPGVNT